jgi:predicted ATPase
VVCQAHGIAQESQWAAPLCGWALVDLGDTKRGLRVLEEGLAAHSITRSALLRPYYFCLLASALLRARELTRAQRALDDARAVALSTGQQAYAAEHARIQAELLMVTGRPADADAFYREAIAIARAQGALWFELRGARAFASAQAALGRPDAARATLAPVVARVQEGRGTPDYAFAAALLETFEEAS